MLYESLDDLQKKIYKENFKEENLLVFLFSDESVEKLKEIINNIKKIYPNVLLAGASSAGNIHNGHTVDNSSVITFCQFEKISPKGIILPLEDYSYEEMATEIKNKVLSDESKLLFLLSDGSKADAVSLLDEISLTMTDLPIAGGKAGKVNPLIGNTYVFLNDQIISGGAVAISLNGKYLRVSQSYRLNWKKIGKKLKVTEAEGNIIKSIDDIPILEVYKKYLGNEFIKGIPQLLGTEFPFIINRDGVDVARSLVKILDDNSVLYHGDIKEGEEVQFSYGNIPTIINEVKNEYSEAVNFQPQGIFVFSCLARRYLLQKSIDYEIEPFELVAPTTGFFTFGEFFHREGKNFLLNITMTLLLLSEEAIDKSVDEKEFSFLGEKESENRLESITKTLMILIDQVSTELEEKNAILQKLSYIDSLTGLYNRRFFSETLDHETKRALRYKRELSLAILDIDDFKEINDLYGHNIGDIVLRNIASKIQEICRDTDIACRYGGDEIVIIFLETDLDNAKKVCDRICQSINNNTFSEKEIKITLSIGLAQLNPKDVKNIMNKADENLYEAKNNGKNKVICSKNASF